LTSCSWSSSLPPAAHQATITGCNTMTATSMAWSTDCTDWKGLSGYAPWMTQTISIRQAHWMLTDTLLR
jgi:hypothetical protein